jgi:hypothetical protein
VKPGRRFTRCLLAAGFGNYIVIDNANDLVVVTRWMDDSKMGDFMKLVEQSITNQSTQSKHECTTAVLQDLALLSKKLACYLN